MGNKASAGSATSNHHFTLSEIKRLKGGFSKYARNGVIGKEDFKTALKSHVNAWSDGVQLLFLERLFDVFDVDGSQTIDFNEFITGLSVFFKGEPEEKQVLTFQIYDIDKSGSIEPKELIKILSKMVSETKLVLHVLQ
jgi:Ca2+-binding EF-hand superfamily protein